MKLIAFFFLSLLLSPNSQASHDEGCLKAATYDCARDADCKIVRGTCSQIAISGTSSKSVQKCLDKRAHPAQCGPTKNITPTCVRSRCTNGMVVSDPATDSVGASDCSTFRDLWSACESDSDCVVINGICGKDAANSKFRDQAEGCNKTLAMRTNCTAPKAESTGLKAMCIKKSCALEGPAIPKPSK